MSAFLKLYIMSAFLSCGKEYLKIWWWLKTGIVNKLPNLWILKVLRHRSTSRKYHFSSVSFTVWPVLVSSTISYVLTYVRKFTSFSSIFKEIKQFIKCPFFVLFVWNARTYLRKISEREKRLLYVTVKEYFSSTFVFQYLLLKKR